MNKTAIKNFAIWARNKLLADIKSKAMLAGITEAGIAEKMPISTPDTEFYDIGTREPVAISGKAIRQRRELVKVLQKKAQSGDYQTAFQSVIEEVAYTWFNRLIALRFMEVNGYLYDDMRILSSVSPGKVEPDAVTNPFDWNLEFSEAERTDILNYQAENKIDDLFRLLFIAECNALNEYLPYLFEKTADYTEFLLTISVTDIDGVVYKLVHDIPESDFNVELGGQVEIIGWLYQYYNTEPKDKVFADLKKNIKVTKEKIPAATQLFTPDWIVRYMVENSLGRLWLEGHPDAILQDSWKYYLPEAPQEPEVAAQLAELRKARKALNPENIRIIDPCMGSGHILVYAFEVLMEIYRSQGYTDREAAQLIITNNLYGLDIDQRAFQLAYFAVMMCGRRYDRRILTRGLEPNLCAIEESNGLTCYKDLAGEAMVEARQLNFDDQYMIMADYLIEKFHDAKEYGSILNVDNQNYDAMLEYFYTQDEAVVNSIFMNSWLMEMREQLPRLAKQAKIMSRLYDVVVTNPPYMGLASGNSKLNNYVKKNFPESKADLFAVFIDVCGDYIKSHGYQAMITQQSWMFLSSFEKLREKVLSRQIINLLQLGARAFDEIGGEVVQTSSFVFLKANFGNYKGAYSRLVDFSGEEAKRVAFLSKENIYISNQHNFKNIPGVPIAYWVSKNVAGLFLGDKISDYFLPKFGMSTGDGNRYVRYWFEPSRGDISFSANNEDEYIVMNKTWCVADKGGKYRRWYGNREYVILWKDNGAEIKANPKSAVRSPQYFFKPHISWTLVSSGIFSARMFGNGFLLDTASNCLYYKENIIDYYPLALLNSKVAQIIFNILNPTINMSCGVVAEHPLLIKQKKEVLDITLNNITLSKHDWDGVETSWDFTYNPLYAAYHLGKPTITHNAQDNSLLISNAGAKEDKTLSQCYEEYKACTNEMFVLLKSNEEELNRIFIEIYGLQEELTPEVADKDVTIASIFDSKEDIPDSYKGNNYVLTREDVVKNLISYAVGCLFGRYSLKKPGLIYAGGDWEAIAAENWSEEELARGIPDNDNVLPITDEVYFEDDIAGRFVRWLADAFGTAHLEENLNFIADALSVKGANSRDIIRNYFLTGFYKDHVQKYQKRPIYWLYDSGKANGFKALVYMHRYDADTTGRVRMDYLHRMEQTYGDEINRLTGDISEASDNREKARLQKCLLKLQKQAKECQDYDELIGHLALERIVIDLDDGVKVNYEKVQTDRNGKKYQILGKI